MIALLLVALFQGAAPVSSFTAPTAQPAKAVQPGKDGIACRKEVILGSRLKTKVCSRPGDARQRIADDRDLVEKAQTLQKIWDPANGPPP